MTLSPLYVVMFIAWNSPLLRLYYCLSKTESTSYFKQYFYNFICLSIHLILYVRCSIYSISLLRKLLLKMYIFIVRAFALINIGYNVTRLFHDVTSSWPIYHNFQVNSINNVVNCNFVGSSSNTVNDLSLLCSLPYICFLSISLILDLLRALYSYR